MLEVTPLGGLQEIGHDRASHMHKRGHTYYRTACPNRCQQADEWAARRLITPRTVIAAVRHAQCVEGVAEVLRVSPAMVRAYFASLPADEWAAMHRLVGRELV
jgi:hypothetical protein